MTGLGSADEIGIGIIVDTAIDMLMTGCDLFVNKNDFTPGRLTPKKAVTLSETIP